MYGHRHRMSTRANIVSSVLDTKLVVLLAARRKLHLFTAVAGMQIQPVLEQSWAACEQLV